MQGSFALRGAIAPVENTEASIAASTRTLLTAMMDENNISKHSVVFAFFTVSGQINEAFPATAARTLMGWHDIPMMCGLEMPVKGSLQGCLRVLLMCQDRRPAFARRRRGSSPYRRPVHVYLGEAACLRPDLGQGSTTVQARGCEVPFRNVEEVKTR